MRWSVVPLALLAGCWLTDAELQGKLGDDVVDDTGSDDPIAVSSVDPPWGTTAGGTEVTITADPVGEGVIVRFGDANAAILSVDGSEVVVRTPAGTAGPVDVDVQWGAHAGEAQHGFEYFTDGTDRYGAVGAVAWFDVVGLLALGYLDGGSAWVNFTDRSQYGYDAFYGTTTDTCASGWAFPGTIVEASDGTEVRLVREGASGLTLPWNSQDDAYSVDLVAEGSGANAWVSNGVFDLEPIVGVVDYPPVGAKAFVRTPSVFAVQTDCDLCGGASPLDDIPPPTVFQDDFQVRWDTSNPGDYVVIRIDSYGDDDTLDEQVRCLAGDDGEFTVPSSVWTTTSGLSVSSIDIWVGRARASTALLPHDNSKIGVAGVYWVVGTATMYPP